MTSYSAYHTRFHIAARFSALLEDVIAILGFGQPCSLLCSSMYEVQSDKQLLL